MSDSTIVEILLGVLALMVGIGSFVGASRAAKVQAIGMQADVESDAFERAKGIYEGAIQQLEAQLSRIRHEAGELEGDVARLRVSERQLRVEMAALRDENQQLREENARLLNGGANS